ncbi:MAG: HAMP domain-containing protein [candidate division NC10 bacterium]|nr:HAMP domain-containing protein [candidate division NC10 bacterium]
MKSWSLRLKITALVVGLAAGSSLAASAVHGWLAFHALRDDVRNRAAAIASDIAFGITTPQELANRDLLALQIRNIMAARPTLRRLDIFADGPNGLIPVASSRDTLPPRPPEYVAQAFAEARTVTVAGTSAGQEAWLAAAPIRFGGATAGVAALAISLEGANRLALNLGQQLLFVLVVASGTIIVSLALFMERNINRPIRALLATMVAVERGDLSVAPVLARQDEMGQLADGLTNMLRRIRTSHEENTQLLERINRFNQDLQIRVAEATQELANRNEALRRANELLFDLQRQLGRAQRLATLGQLTAAIAHEIGTPLNSISVHLQLLARSLGLTQQDRQRLVTIEGQVRRLVQTVQERLAATRGVARRPEPTDLNELVRGVTDLMAPVLAAKGIACSFATDGVLPKVWVDGHQIQQVVLNLLTNAVDAMPAGGSIRVETGVADGKAFLRVADSGPGIPPEARERIFEPFFTTKEQGQGTGLGLAISRQIVEAHRGTIEATSPSGGGTIFEIRLPLESKEGRG